MEYNILGISIQCKVEVNGRIDKTDDNRQRYQIFVAWQSNLPKYSFCWRCTCGEKAGMPTSHDIHAIASRGFDARDKRLVKKLFPMLPATRLSE